MERPHEDQPKEEWRKEKKGQIHIPSYQEVFSGSVGDGSSSSQPYNPLPPTSFFQAFSFIKSSEFYTPPPLMEPPKEQAQKVSDPLASDSASASCSSTYSAPSSYTSVSHSLQNRNAILVSHRQEGNPLLKHIRNVKWAFADIICDYLVGQGSCALYISLRYHLLHPDYLYYRIRELQKDFKLRVILCHIDVEDVVKPLLEVTRTAIFHDCTLLCGWSLEECGRYLETIKIYENKSADSIREQTDTDYLSRLTHALTTVRHVNRTDVLTLGSTFGSLSGIMDASMEDLARCPGIGERKVKRLYDAFHEPFRRVTRRPPLTIPEAFSKASKRDEEPAKEAGHEKPSIDENRRSVAGNSNIRSALDAALSKYGERVGKRPPIHPSRKATPVPK